MWQWIKDGSINFKELERVENIVDNIIKESPDCLITKVDFSHLSFDGFPTQRRRRLQSEIKKRYRNAGWKIEMVLGEELDSTDYMILTGKNKKNGANNNI